MAWITHNWPWILVGIGFVWFMSRGRTGMGCCGGGHSHGAHKGSPEPEKQENSTSTKSCCH